MAHFAKLNENNIVIEIVVIANSALNSNNEEASGIAFLTEWSGGYTNWKQTSYNNNIRKQHASIGCTYDAVNDVFIRPQPYPSWTLDNEFNWQPPTPKPIEGVWYWNEEELTWKEVVND